jgi:predicted ester cyclase
MPAWSLLSTVNPAVRERRKDMSEKQGALALRFFEEADRGRTPLELLAPGFTAYFNGVPPMDAAAFDGFETMIRAAFSDIHHRVEAVVVRDDDVAVRLTFEATHTGEFMGVHSAGTRVAVDGTAFLRIAEDRIATMWGFLDQLALMQQIGGLPTTSQVG